MCGICGMFSPSATVEKGILRRMTDTLHHRGPDDSDLWLDEAAGLGLGHRRLSILDLSPLGRQPMHSASGRFVICFNGEVFNFARIQYQSGLALYGHGHINILGQHHFTSELILYGGLQRLTY